MFNVSDPEPPAADDGVDDSLIVRAARSDPAAFAPLYRRYVTRVYRYIYSRVGNNADAEDLTAQVFLAALEGLQRYHEQVSQEEALMQLRSLVRQLSDEEQELLRLRFAAGLRYEQMALVLGRKEAAVKMALHRLIHRLNDIWGVKDE